jgi:hypothetical protein
MPTSSPQSKALTRLRALGRELIKDVGYASADSTQAYWSKYQKRRSQQSIRRKKTECERLARALPRGQERWATIEGLLAAHAHDWRDNRWDGPSTPDRGAVQRRREHFGREQREERSMASLPKLATVTAIAGAVSVASTAKATWYISGAN